MARVYAQPAGHVGGRDMVGAGSYPPGPMLLHLQPPTIAAETRAVLSLIPGEAEVVRRGVFDVLRLARWKYAGARAVVATGHAARGAVGARVPVVYVPEVRPRRSELAALGLLKRRAPVVGVCTTVRAASALRTSGFGFASVHRIPPTASLPVGRTARDNALRERLGFAADDKVVLAVGPSVRERDHVLALWAVGILSFLDRRWKLLVGGVGAETERLRRFAFEATTPGLVTFATDVLDPQAWGTPLCPAADYALDTTSPTAWTDCRPLLEAVATELPVLATASHAAREFLTAESIEPTSSPKALARRLLDLDESAGDYQRAVAASQAAALRLRSMDPTAAVEAVLAGL